jgi:signal transduction histidine kinase/DNA-binding response OmpR family regulator
MRSVRTGDPYEVEGRVRRASDSSYQCHLIRGLAVRGEAGEVLYWFGTCTDIEDQRRARQAAEANSRAKGEFLANMSHEIRTPMNGIIGMTELLLGTAVTREQRDYLQMVSDSAEGLRGVINDILDFSKVDAGRLELERRPFAVREVLGDAVRGLAVTAEKKGLELSCRVAPDLPERLLGDGGRLRQIVLNLVSNAIKFTTRGEVVVDVEKQAEADGHVTLHAVVRDTGMGIPADRQAAVFEPFTQADGSTTRRFGGTGLGLPISAQLASLLGGRIWLESSVGHGSAFHFTARFASLTEDAGVSQRLDVAGLHGRRILVVDDHPTNRRILEEMLRSWGLQPAMARDGEDAIAELERARQTGLPFPVVILDAHMPGLDGFAVAARIREDPELAATVIMMLSSSNQAAEGARCREHGGLPYVVKPITSSHLMDALLSALTPAELAIAGQGLPAAPAARRLRVLLAEDNAVNRRLVIAILEKRGHAVVAVENGREALTAIAGGGFDLVLMDVHMPEMDGFTTTQAIRDAEQGAGRHIPVVALTARAMQGDREICLAAGMDDYLVKPIRGADLLRVVERQGDGISAGAHALPADAASAPTAFAVDELLAQVDGDRSLLAELVGLLRAESPRMLRDLRRSLEASDPGALRTAAHAIKGALGNFGARDACAAAQALETLGREGTVEGAAARLAALERAVEGLEGGLVRFLEGAPA